MMHAIEAMKDWLQALGLHADDVEIVVSVKGRDAMARINSDIKRNIDPWVREPMAPLSMTCHQATIRGLNMVFMDRETLPAIRPEPRYGSSPFAGLWQDEWSRMLAREDFGSLLFNGGRPTTPPVPRDPPRREPHQSPHPRNAVVALTRRPQDDVNPADQDRTRDWEVAANSALRNLMRGNQ